MTEKPPQRWDLVLPSGAHRISVQPTSWSRVVTWSVADGTVAEKKSSEDTLVLTSPEHGAVRVRFTWSGASTRATWFAPEEVAQAHLGVGGVDLEPEPGSPAAAREARMRKHPRLYAARHVVSGVAKVVVPFVVLWLLARVAIDLPFPDVPRPDLPGLPSVPLPDLSWPDWRPPEWVRWVLEKKSYVLPVVIGVAVAVAEVRRRRRQDELREQRRAGVAEPEA